MEVAYLLGSNQTPLRKKYQVGATMANAGVPVTVAGSGGYGLQLVTTTAAANCVGVTLDAVTTNTTQPTDGSDPRRMVSVIVNPDAVLKARLSGGATAGTALSTETENTASSTGLIAQSGTDFSNFDEGGVFWYTGANKGPASFRKIITGDATNADVGVPWPNDPVVGDKFVVLPFSTMDLQYVQLTSNFTEVDASAAVDTNNANFIPIELQGLGVPGDALTSSYVLMTIADHLYASS